MGVSWTSGAGCLLLSFVACNALSGADGLEVGASPGETGGPSSSGSSGTAQSSSSSGGATSSGSPAHDRPQPDASPPPTQTDAGFDAATDLPPGFSDLFDRPDGPAIGNGWVEKTDKFSLAGGAVLQTGVGLFTNFIVYRPDIHLDAQTSVDVTYGANVDSDPCLHLRMQPASDNQGELVAYTFYAYRDYAAIDREDPGDNVTELASAVISPELEVGKTYRMIFRVTGTDPVKLEATIVKPDGNPGATLSATDGSKLRITASGKIGFGSGSGDAMRWDNFFRIDL